MTQDTIRFTDLVRGVLRALPETLTFNKGVWNLATVFPHQKRSIGLLVEKFAASQPEHPALRFEDRVWTYAEFNAAANRIAAVLRAQGVRPGDAVALMMENRGELLIAVTAIVKLGATAGMLNFNQRGEVLAHSIGLTQARVIIIGEECFEALQTTPYAPGGKQALVTLWDGAGKPPKGALALRDMAAGMSQQNPAETAQVLASTPAFYIFTSGTTGMPKASVMSHYRWLKGMAGLGQMALRIQRDDVFYCALPLYHNNGLTVSWGSVLGAGATMALSRKFSASKFWDEIRAHEATVFCYIGELCRYLLNKPPAPGDRQHRVRLMVGNGLRAEIWEEFQQRFGIANISEFYGASESNLAFVNGFGLSKTAGFSPLPFAIVEFDAEAEAPLRDARGFMRKAAKGEPGLLISKVTKLSPFEGYTDKKASEKKLFRDVFKKGDVWFNTGDLVRDQGWRHIQFVDRVGDTFRWKGENVATTEVEGALGRHPGVEQAVVYGVQVPGCDGRAGMAALTCSGGFDGAALAAQLCKDLPAYAVPLFIRLRPEQEVTGTFKFRKVDLKNEGFDPAKVSEPLYVLADRGRGYEPLTAELFAAIGQGRAKL